MMRFLARWILKLSGWTLDENMPQETSRCVMVAAPHTSNWDFFYMLLSFYIMRIPMRYTIKKEWMWFPMSLLAKATGALAIDRTVDSVTGKRKSYVQIMADLFENKKEMAMVITPEGSRAKREEWKLGFYYTAELARVPICLAFLDYKKKLAGVLTCFMPTENLESDMRKIMDAYRSITACVPAQFSLDVRFA